MTGLFTAFLTVSLSCVPGILLLLMLRPLLHKKLAGGILCLLWALFCVRLLFPVQISFPTPVLSIPRVESREVIITVPKEPETQNNQNVASQGNTAQGGETAQKPGENKPPEQQPGNKTQYVFSAPLFFSVVWAAGAALYGLYLLLGRFYLYKLVKRWSNAQVNPELILLADKITAIMGLKKKVRLVRCGNAASPMLTGIFCPCMLLPNTDKYSDEQWRFVLRHELMHIKRGDLIFKAVLNLVKCLHWYNPLVWIMCREANRAIELACDSAVVHNREKEYRRNYSNALLDTLAQKPLIPIPFTTYFFDGSKQNLMRRFSNIAAEKVRTAGLAMAAASALAALVLGCSIGLAPLADVPKDSNANVSNSPPSYVKPQVQEISISSLQELKDFALKVENNMLLKEVTVEIMADIDFKGESWAPLDLGNNNYYTINGNGHKIKNFKVTEAKNNKAGFFANIGSGSSVNSLHLIGEVSFNNANLEESGVGGFAGVCGAKIEKCTFTGSVNGAMNVGGFVGLIYEGSQFTLCGVDADVSGALYVGGFMAVPFYDSLFEKCWVEGSVSAVAVKNVYTTNGAGMEYKVAYIGGFSSTSSKIFKCVTNNVVLCYENALLLSSFIGFNTSSVVDCYYNSEINAHWADEKAAQYWSEEEISVAQGLTSAEIKTIINSYKSECGI